MSLETELEELLVRYPLERVTNTPPDVLATYMVRSMRLFEMALLERSRHQFFSKGHIDAP